MAKVGVILSGCGVYDGSEIYESVLTLLALDRAGAEVVCMAPDREQFHVINHLNGDEVKEEKRNVLVEAARLARGKVVDIATVEAASLDALILPGGFGAAKNLCDFAVSGPECSVDPGVEELIGEVQRAGKPIGFICIAPAIAAKVLGSAKVELTIGTDPDTAAGLEAMGAIHRECDVGGIVVDSKNKVVSTPAYMLGERISEVAEGIDKLVAEVLKLAS